MNKLQSQISNDDIIKILERHDHQIVLVNQKASFLVAALGCIFTIVINKKVEIFAYINWGENWPVDFLFITSMLSLIVAFFCCLWIIFPFTNNKNCCDTNPSIISFANVAKMNFNDFSSTVFSENYKYRDDLACQTYMVAKIVAKKYLILKCASFCVFVSALISLNLLYIGT